jgi:hypothetical protein
MQCFVNDGRGLVGGGEVDGFFGVCARWLSSIQALSMSIGGFSPRPNRAETQWRLGALPKAAEARENALVAVDNCTWHSRPMTALGRRARLVRAHRALRIE